MSNDDIYQIVDLDQPLMAKVFLHKTTHFPGHWHTCYEFLYVLESRAIVVVDGVRNELKENDIMVINPYSIHSIFAPNGCVILALQADFSKEIKKGWPDRFTLNSYADPLKDYSSMKRNIALMIKTSFDNPPHKDIITHSLLLKILFELENNFASGKEEESILSGDNNKLQLSKLDKILSYIRDNFKEDLSLNRIAEMFSFSPSYLSRLFSSTIGQSYKAYVDEQRLANAETLLMTTDEPINSIASQSGFANARSFVALHKSIYHELPSETKKKTFDKVNGTEKTVYYQDFEKQSYLAKLMDTITEDKSTSQSLPAAISETVMCDAGIIRNKLINTFKEFCCIGRASDMLQDEVQQMLRTTQKEIGFKYIKFHGLFDDRLSVYSNNGKREIFNFTELDRIFDFLLSINLRPLIQLSFMPKDMALTPQREVFFNHPLVISRPKSISKWTELVSKFTLHMINRYGIKEVEKWPFTLWNEPESNKDMFGLLDDEYFASFFSATFDAVKAIDKDISFGFPSITTSTLTETNFLFEFMNLISPRIPDFVLLNFYPMTGLNCFLDDAIESNTLTLDYDKDAMSKCIDKLLEKQKQIQAKVGISLPMYITEWNSTTSHRSTANDLAYKGAYVVRNIISNYDRIGSFGYWSLTDYINEVPEREELFHGGHGLFTRNGIKKPPYYAFLFLSKLYENLIYKNDYLIITKDEANNISSVMCNFINISKLYADGKLSGLNNSSRYSSFESEVTRSQIIKIDSVENGDYVLEEYYVNKYHGSIFDLWLKMFNGNEPANQEEMDMLKTSCTPGFKMHKITILDNAFSYNVILEAHEIRLFKLKRIYKKEEEE